MKRPRMLLPGAFAQLNLSEMQYEEKRQNELLAELLYRVLALGAGLVIAACLVAGLYFASRPAPPLNELPVAAAVR